MFLSAVTVSAGYQECRPLGAAHYGKIKKSLSFCHPSLLITISLIYLIFIHYPFQNIKAQFFSIFLGAFRAKNILTISVKGTNLLCYVTFEAEPTTMIKEVSVASLGN